MTAKPVVRGGASLAWRSVGYQLLLLTRSPLGTFTVFAVPLLLLGALTTVNPSDALSKQGYEHYADFLTPAMATFALLNACYINVATSVVTAREAGVLKRLHSSPLPLWAYLAGRLGAATLVGGIAFWVVMGSGVLFLGVSLSAADVGALLVVMLLGVVTFSLLGLAVSTVVRSADSALPVAFGTFLPVAFVSDVFFPIGDAPTVLRHVAQALPVSAVSRPAEHVLRAGGWPLTLDQVLVLLGWAVVAALATKTLFSWEPGGSLRGVWRSGRRHPQEVPS